MDKHKQPSVAFWQRLTDFAKAQKIGAGWWLILLIFFSISALTGLVWRSLVQDELRQVNNNLQLEAAPIKPQTGLQLSPVTQLTFAGSGVTLEVTRLLANQFQRQTFPSCSSVYRFCAI